MELKYKIKSVIMVNFNDLDEFLAKRFGLPERYEFTAMEELGNDIVKSINVYRKELSEYDQKYIDEFLVTKNHNFIVPVIYCAISATWEKYQKENI
jgi:hypothetical protein